MNEAVGNKTIIVIGNGINTIGQLNFVNNFPAEGASAKAIKYKEAGALPILDGVEVYWYGLGQTDGTLQPGLETQSVSSLVDFWTSVIVESGGNPVGVSAGSLVSREPSKYTIPVSAIEVKSRAACINLTLTEEEGFNFKSDKAEFLDLDLAKNGASQIASNIESKNCKTDVTVTGYVASGKSKVEFEANPEAGKRLSQQRAEAFRQLLIQAGVKIPIIAVGGGKGPVDDWDENGIFDEELGKQNRKVVITQ
jgi:outer membrane protein OmpA-like peptidoglycan-associated protein